MTTPTTLEDVTARAIARITGPTPRATERINCAGCGASYVTLGLTCPLCGYDWRLDLIIDALNDVSPPESDLVLARRILQYLDAEVNP